MLLHSLEEPSSEKLEVASFVPEGKFRGYAEVLAL